MPTTGIQKRRGAYLPHWTVKNGIYSITFRLLDSIPQQRIEEWQRERKDIVDTARCVKRRLTADEMTRLRALHEHLIERSLDNGHGQCWLRRDDVAEIVANALRHFADERYRLFAWCIMPNHVHVVLQTTGDWTVADIMHSWKSFTAKKANTVLVRTGEFWQREYYDHLIRSREDFLRCTEYVWTNPEQNGHREWKWRWKARIVEDSSEVIF